MTTTKQARALVALRNGGTVRDVMALLEMPKSSANALISRLVSGGLVTRERGRGHRPDRIVPTERGERVIRTELDAGRVA